MKNAALYRYKKDFVKNNTYTVSMFFTFFFIGPNIQGEHLQKKVFQVHSLQLT